ncbi:hypothetical protein KKF34_06090 [Myxococcota bacterium]|nr:hypothetical protein [Myxococcota bacterium]MBU1383198.1 hypothetical protein [Myxococcota bacterium]MBU1496432.1 hypothetical protein [Myxococcota bacterium]
MKYLSRITITSSLLVFFSLNACTEPNPDYDPDYAPPCKSGALSCSEDSTNITVCIKDAVSGEMIWTEDKTCWSGTGCLDGYCAPIPETPECTVQADCEEGLVCTALADADNSLSNWCISPPIENGRLGGYACASHDQCLSGWCFRNVCYTPCVTSDDCPLEDECDTLKVTIDNVQDNINGCVLP